MFTGALQDDWSFLLFNIVPEGVQWSFAVVLFLSGIYLAFCCGDARTNEKIRGKTEAKALKNLRLVIVYVLWPLRIMKCLNIIR